MEDLRHYAVFAETVSAGSMSAAARRLRMTPSAVSQTIRALEARTGVVLLHRSTRKLTLTEAGERCLPYCKRLLEARNGAAASLEQARDAPTGELRVAAPIGFAAHISPALAPVLADWPCLRLKLILDDKLVDLIDARVDLAVRVGGLPDTNWIGRKLCDFEGILCASPAYLGRRGAPATPADLPEHDWLAMEGEDDEAVSEDGERGPGTMLDLTDGKGRQERVPLAIRIGTTSQVALHQLCEEGMGLASLFYPDARPALEQGRLVRLLPDWRPPSVPVTMVMPRSGGGVAKARVAADALLRYFAALTATG
ncbi:LysR family transcriptional regulator [Sphingomonas sp.]|uniref:LysR family transcriptional regulator n=1 Tax=Sphingomonas sp. TaxID=28214 RepID=UPI003B00DD63